MTRISRKWPLVFALVIIGALLWNPFRTLVASVRLALAMQALAAGDTDQRPPVRQIKCQRRAGAQNYEALVYSAIESPPTRALVLVAGISELGCYHPRLVALSRMLAGKGFLVITPDIKEFRNFQISAEPIDQILFWFNQATTLENGRHVSKTGLAGISFSGTLALIAAARPEIRERVAFVVGIGAYGNLIRCTKEWFAGEPIMANREYYPTRFYARWIIMLAARDLLPDPEDRSLIGRCLECLLLQKKVPPPDGLTLEGNRWYRLAIARGNGSDPELANEIEKFLVPRLYKQLDPNEALRSIHCPVFLIHGAYDDLIPAEESRELYQKIADSYLLVSPFLTHTHPSEHAITVREKLGAVVQTVVFCYQFSRILA
jgi:pimeloyl-ACP methyl ester carboxylesterase